MVLLIDIGNTSTTYGYGKGRTLLGIRHVSTDHFPKIAHKLFKNKDNSPKSSIVICSVVPKVTRKVLNLVPRRNRPSLHVVGKNLKVPIRHKYINFNRLGSDRAVNIYGAVRLYRVPLVIFDFGTALTCDYISNKGEFLGGLIVPGPEIALKALSEKAALLPSLDFPRKYGAFLGRDTQGGMKAGILQGYGAMADGLVERFRSRYGRNLKVIATGGLAPLIHPHTSQIDISDPLLTLKSLALLFRDQA